MHIKWQTDSDHFIHRDGWHVIPDANRNWNHQRRWRRKIYDVSESDLNLGDRDAAFIFRAFVWKLPVPMVVLLLNSDQLFKCIPTYLYVKKDQWIKVLV